MPKCRCCKGEIDKADTISWVMPSQGWYYHTKCYDDWIRKKEDIHAVAEDDEWKGYLWDYLSRDLKLPKLNYQKCDQQWHSFLSNKKKMTAKGLYYACRYFYEVIKGNPAEAQGGIGILPYVYDDSCMYWTNREKINKEVCQQIEEQCAQKEVREVIQVIQRQTKKEKPQMSLADVLALEDEE